jgi:hypothetical protein
MNPTRQHPQRNHRYVSAAALVIALLAWPVIAGAYGLSGVGGSLGYASPENYDGTASLGVHAVLEKPGSKLHMDPNMRYWNVNGVSDLAPNMDLTWHFRPESHWTPYVGGGMGVNFVHQRALDRSDTDLGVNAIAGVRFPSAANRVFLEGRYTASDINQVSLQTGITFHAR